MDDNGASFGLESWKVRVLSFVSDQEVGGDTRTCSAGQPIPSGGRDTVRDPGMSLC